MPDTEWRAYDLSHGMRVKLKELPFHVRLFKLVATNGDHEWVITNRVTIGDAHGALTAVDVQEANALRWQIEQSHRELKAERFTGEVSDQNINHESAITYLHRCCAYMKLEGLKIRTQVSHFAIKSKIYLSAVKAAYAELVKFNPQPLAA